MRVTNLFSLSTGFVLVSQSFAWKLQFFGAGGYNSAFESGTFDVNCKNLPSSINDLIVGIIFDPATRLFWDPKGFIAYEEPGCKGHKYIGHLGNNGFKYPFRKFKSYELH
ncbi:hypothetical protein N7532_007202 [Penicillium argentinense]|uniref:Uncharacterized protein n=1 Tax=Penicillium argentinense TaxID=1131581 RepID=A0A9W9F778_9EURO|nr:uncharacterized protein N7532_007202 [Penicillium argentinense]KAJ5094911.1 hypothetical protein N7532_007202 [Penicillium argentinense]